jgi:TM2 domain-containing membrane protein YozV
MMVTICSRGNAYNVEMGALVTEKMMSVRVGRGIFLEGLLWYLLGCFWWLCLYGAVAVVKMAKMTLKNNRLIDKIL